MTDVFELKIPIGITKYSPHYQRAGRARDIIDGLKKALNSANAELRIAERELRATRETVTR